MVLFHMNSKEYAMKVLQFYWRVSDAPIDL
jgi:hypothetical protein